MKTVFNTEDNTYIRVGNDLAKILVAKGTHRFSTKSKFKSLVNRGNKLKRNQALVDKRKLNQGIGEGFYKDPYNGNIYAYLVLHPKKAGKWSNLSRLLIQMG